MTQQKVIGQDILDAALGKYKRQGFKLYSCQRDVLALDYEDKPLCTFNSVGATIVKVREACQRYLNTGRAW